MKNNLILILIFSFVIFLLGNCGIQPPTQDLDLAKTKIAAADEVEASKYAPNDYADAQKLLATGKTNIVQEKSTKNKDAKKFLEQAQLKADAAYSNAAPKYADFNINELQASITKGKEIKADVAAKDEFNKAQVLLDESKDAYAKKDYKTAWTKAKAAKDISDNAYKIANDKKINSENAINEAKKKLSEVEQNTK